MPYPRIPTTTQNPGRQVAYERRKKWKPCSSRGMDWMKHSSLCLLEVLRGWQGLHLLLEGSGVAVPPGAPVPQAPARYMGIMSREHAQQAFNLMSAATVVITALYYWYYYSSFSFYMDFSCSLGDKGGGKNGLQGGLNAV